MTVLDSNYGKMWEDFAVRKSKTYNETKFSPVNRVGLTNCMREKKIIEYTLDVSHDRILDIGCASGRQVFLLAPYCAKAVGIDIAQSFVNECNEQKIALSANNTEFYVGDFDAMPQGEFDVIICGEVLEHVFNLSFSIDALDASTRKGGHILITVPHYNADGTWWGRLMRLLGMREFTPFTNFADDEIAKHGDAHVREFTCASLAAPFVERGYVVKRLMTVAHFDGPLSDKVIDLFLDRMPFTRNFFVAIEKMQQMLFPYLGRHIVLLVQKPL